MKLRVTISKGKGREVAMIDRRLVIFAFIRHIIKPSIIYTHWIFIQIHIAIRSA